MASRENGFAADGLVVDQLPAVPNPELAPPNQVKVISESIDAECDGLNLLLQAEYGPSGRGALWQTLYAGIGRRSTEAEAWLVAPGNLGRVSINLVRQSEIVSVAHDDS